MAKRLASSDSNFQTDFDALLASKRAASAEVDDVVRAILDDVRARGDEAVFEYTEKFDRLKLTTQTLRISASEIADAAAKVPKDVAEALQFAHDRIRSHHAKQRPEDQLYTDELGVKLGSKWTAVEAVGIYVPGGLASYPSSVLMNAVPAKVAGVDRIAMVVPTPDGSINPAVLLAAKIAGIDEIYRIGGAQAIAALAYGTKSIAPVAKIVGPGNAYVAGAKRQVFGTVGIDMIAGPSDVLVIADDSANPAWVAADLLAQTEHGAGAQSIAITTDQVLADAISDEVKRQLQTLRRRQITADGWRDFGAIITVSNLAEAVELANRIAPEHLELAVDNPESLLASICNVGAIFLGHHTPEAVGDYVGGSNHVLPTASTSRFASGLGTMDFMKRTSLLQCSPEALSALGAATISLAESEDLQAHGRSVSIRLNR